MKIIKHPKYISREWKSVNSISNRTAQFRNKLRLANIGRKYIIHIEKQLCIYIHSDDLLYWLKNGWVTGQNSDLYHKSESQKITKQYWQDRKHQSIRSGQI